MTSITDDVSDHVSTLTEDVSAPTGDVVSLTDPDTTLSEDVASTVDDVGSLTGQVTSLLSPPQTSPPDDAPRQQGSLVDQAASLLGGLGKG